MNISTLILFVFGFAGLMIGGELLVRSASQKSASGVSAWNFASLVAAPLKFHRQCLKPAQDETPTPA
jgi:hypothetical protein